MTEKDEKGAAAPPAITPRKHVPRPSVTKAKTTGPVPAPPASTKSDAASTSGKSSAEKSTEAKGGATVPAAKGSSAPAPRPEPAGDVTPPSKPSTPAATPASPAVSEASPVPTSSGTSSTAAAGAPVTAAASAAATPGRTASPVSPVVDADTGPAPVAQSPDETAAAPAGTPRKVRLSLSRVDPWSVMKLSFLLSVAGGIMLIVASWVFWYAINDMGIFTQIDEMVRDIVGAESTLDILQYVERDKVLSIATLIAVVDVVLLTALGTIGAFLYNVTAALVGGLHVTLTDE